MIDREKVIKGLECCISLNGRLDERYCDDCPYNYQSDGTCASLTPLLDDVLRLITKLEPHFIGLTEIKEGEGYWLSVNDLDFVPRPVICVHIESDARKPYITFAWQYGTFSWESETYGSEWSLWSAKPYSEKRGCNDD